MKCKLIYKEAQRLTSLINDFLDVQRMESGKQTFEKKYEDVLDISITAARKTTMQAI